MPRLLFDENLSHHLVQKLATAFPGSHHVRDLGLLGRPDEEIHARAAADDSIVVTKDDDFRHLCFLRGSPPRVVWLVVGNAGTDPIAALLQRNRDRIEQFAADPDEALLVLRLPHAVSP